MLVGVRCVGVLNGCRCVRWDKKKKKKVVIKVDFVG